MTRTVQCARLGKELPGLNTAPYPGEIGQKIFDSISAEAWSAWQDHQTMLINEYRLSMLDPEARSMLEKEMVAFLFEGKDTKPAGYTE
jgi:Fe-S cluster biosynthesis and repair protein YggX